MLDIFASWTKVSWSVLYNATIQLHSASKTAHSEYTTALESKQCSCTKAMLFPFSMGIQSNRISIDSAMITMVHVWFNFKQTRWCFIYAKTDETIDYMLFVQQQIRSGIWYSMNPCPFRIFRTKSIYPTWILSRSIPESERWLFKHSLFAFARYFLRLISRLWRHFH